MGRDDELLEYAEDDEGKAIKWRVDRNTQDGRTTDHAANARQLLARRKRNTSAADAMKPNAPLQKKAMRGMASLQKRWVKSTQKSNMDEGKRRALDKFEEALNLGPRENEQPDLHEKLEALRREVE